MKRNALSNSVALSFVSILCCAVCLMGVTWAWFTSSAAVRTNEIKTADFETVYTVTDEDGNPVEPVNGKYVFDKTVKYKVTVTGYGTASTGFAVFSVEDEDVIYHSVQLNPKDENENSISFYVRGYSPLIVKDGNWGTSSQQDNVFDGDPRFIKNPVKLIPADENSTAVIQRDGKVETWVDYGSVMPYGISADSVSEPDETVVAAESYDEWFVYGLKDNMTKDDYADFVKVSDSETGRMEIVPTENGYGTGTVINVYEGDKLVEVFHVIIFGDIDGNGKININDSALLRTEAVDGDWSVEGNRVAFKVRATDLDLNDKININDSALLRSAVVGDIEIDQTTGKAG